ncbi:MAG: hypothetical protein ABF322_06290 [Lentimonas sp.]
MSDQSKEIRPKLKLPSAPKSQEADTGETTAAAVPEAFEPAVSQPVAKTAPPEVAPKPKLKMAAMSLPTEDPEKASPPAQDVSVTAPPPPPPPQQPVKDESAATLFPSPEQLVKSVEIVVPPQMATDTNPESSSPSGTEVKTDSPLLSIAIIAALFLILAAVAVGIQLVLMPTPEETPTAETPAAENQAVTAPPTHEVTPTAQPKKAITSQIARTKEVIATVPVMETIPNISEPPPTAKAPTQINITSNEVTSAKSTPVDVAQESTQQMQASAEKRAEIRDAATLYLAGTHIDGLRNGSKPKVMINAESYLVGEIVDETTGLSFEGLKDGKILFKDRNGLYYLKSF